MKNVHNFFRNATMLLAAISLASLIIVSCSKKESENTQVTKPHFKTVGICPDTVRTLWAGQNIDAGLLIVTNDETNLYVEFKITSTDPDLAMTEVHVWVGRDISECPMNNNSLPKVGKFTYYADATSSKPDGMLPFLTNPLDYKFSIPLADLEIDLENDCNAPFFVAAHAKTAVETIWGEGERFVPAPGDWAMYSAYNICCEFYAK